MKHLEPTQLGRLAAYVKSAIEDFPEPEKKPENAQQAADRLKATDGLEPWEYHLRLLVNADKIGFFEDALPPYDKIPSGPLEFLVDYYSHPVE